MLHRETSGTCGTSASRNISHQHRFLIPAIPARVAILILDAVPPYVTGPSLAAMPIPASAWPGRLRSHLKAQSVLEHHRYVTSQRTIWMGLPQEQAWHLESGSVRSRMPSARIVWAWAEVMPR